MFDIDPALLDGKLVVDAMNYWPGSDGVLTALEDGGSSEVAARRLSGPAVVKALNHIGYHELEDRARPAGAPYAHNQGAGPMTAAGRTRIEHLKMHDRVRHMIPRHLFCG